MAKSITLNMRTDKPSESGEYLVATFGKGEKKPSFIMNMFYNAETGLWNDRFGEGKYAVEIDAWAEIPEMRW